MCVCVCVCVSRQAKRDLLGVKIENRFFAYVESASVLSFTKVTSPSHRDVHVVPFCELKTVMH